MIELRHGPELNWERELQGALVPVLDEIVSASEYNRAFVAVVDEEEGTLRGVAGVNVPHEVVDSLSLRLDNFRSPMARSLLTQEPVSVPDALADPLVPDDRRDFYSALGMVSFVAIPLLPATGVLVVGKPSPITERDLRSLRPYAERIAASLGDRLGAKRLRESGERQVVEKEWLKWMVNAVQDPILLSDERDAVVVQNLHAEQIFTSSPDDSEGKRRAIELNNVLLSAALSSLTLDPNGAVGRELTLVDPVEGDELLFEVICQPATNLRTGERGQVAVLKDVTDLRRAIGELQQSLRELSVAGDQARAERDHLNLILENVADPIVVTDPESEIILMNPSAERLLQARPQRTARKDESSYRINDAKLTSFLSQLRLEPGSVKRDELQFEDPETRELLTMEVTATEVRDELGQVTAVVSVLHDLTKLRELERRTIEQQLFESEKLAAVGRLAATVAHEINNPLEAIKNALYLLVSRTPEDDPNRKFVEIASRETERVSSVVRQMLGFYRREGVKAPVDVNEVVNEVIAVLERQLRQHRILVQRELAERLPAVEGSADQIKQVFLNLVINAQQAMPQGGELRISTALSRTEQTRPRGEGWVVVEFADNGTGIGDDDLRHIFEPFYSTKRGGGTGLGLWVSQEIVQQHGGQIKVRTRPGKGTSFVVALPVGRG